MAGPDGSQYQGYQNESETTTLLSPSPPSSPSRGDPPSKPKATAKEDVRKHYKYALGTGYMFAMGVCGIVLVALGSTLDDLADNCGTTATDVSVCAGGSEISRYRSNFTSLTYSTAVMLYIGSVWHVLVHLLFQVLN